MIVTTIRYIRFNGEHKYRLLDTQELEKMFKAVIHFDGSDVLQLKADLKEIDLIEILDENEAVQISHNTSFNTLKTMSLCADGEYTDADGNSFNAIELFFAETEWENLVQRLNAQINPIVDYEVMEVEEYAAVIKERMGKACTEAIYAGVDVETEFGIEHFSATEEDQRNIKALCDIALSTKQSLPYHADGTQCKVYSFEDIAKIYASIQGNILYHTTYCNAMNMLIKKQETKDALSALVYGQEITDEEILKEMNAALAQGQAVMESILGAVVASVEAE